MQMSQRLRGRLMATALAVPLLAVLAACGDSDKDSAKKAATAACPSTINQTVSTQLPSDVPSPSGSAYNYSNQGKTQVWFFAIAGSADQLASLRDAYDQQLTGKGYKIEGTDQEEGAEAESDFSGPHDGTTNFRPLCTGKVVFRVKLTS
jgi:hypothetical protein